MTGSRSARSRAPHLVLLVLAYTVAAGLAWFLSRGVSGQISALDPEPVPVTAVVSSAALDYSVKATVSGTLAAPQPVLASGVAGTVTGVLVAPGAILGPGSDLVVVDGLVIRAYVAETAFYRTLTVGDRGPDVAAAQTVLSALLPGTRLRDDGRFGSSTAHAVKQYEAMLGIPAPSGVFDPAWFARLPRDGYVVGAVNLQAGQVAPARGETLVEGATSIVDPSLQLEAEQGGPDGTYQFSYQGEQLVVEKADGAYGFVDPSGVDALLAAVEGDAATAEISGTLSLAEPVVGQAVPPSALVESSQGRQCVLLSSGPLPVPTSVKLVGSALDGMALIEATLPSDAEVIINPGEIAPDATCP